MKFSPVLLALTALLFAGATRAATINVPADYSTIQAAINAASNGDTVIVAPGTYYELLSFGGKAITLMSSGGASVTILDGNNSGPIVTFNHGETSASVLQGFTLTHAHEEDVTGFGPAVEINGTAAPTILDNRFIDNVGQDSAAISVPGGTGTPAILRNYFADNICSNSADDAEAATLEFPADSPVVADNVFVNNACPAIFIVTGNVYNNTMVGNQDGIIFYRYSNSSSISFSNNLIAFNKYGLNATLYNSTVIATWSHNLVYGNNTANYQGAADQTGINGNISSNPVLKDWLGGDVHLLYGSQAIDTGDSTVAQASSTDFYGNTRIFAGMPGDSAIVDIGADEYEPPLVSAVDGSLNVEFDMTTSGAMAFANADPGEPLTFALVTLPMHGTVTLTNASTGAFKYSPANGYLGSDSFTFDITDPYGTVSNTATEQVTVAYFPPTANDGSLTTTADKAVVGTLSASAIYPGQLFKFSLVSNPAHGTVKQMGTTSRITYTPVTGYAGADSLSFQVIDTHGAVSNTATESITVTDIAPKAINGGILTRFAQAHDTLSNTLPASTAYAGQSLSYSVVSQPAHGTVTITNPSTGAFTYTMNPGYSGNDSFTFQAVDQWGASSNVATLSIRVY